MRNRTGWMLIGIAIGWATSAHGQVFQVDGGNSTAAEFRSAATSGGPMLIGEGEVLHAEVTHSLQKDSVAVVGISKPQPFFGFGGLFEGGFGGVRATAELPGPVSRQGVFGLGSNGDGTNIGVFGAANAPNAGATAYGVYGSAGCAGGTACTKASIYASGDLVVTGSLSVLSDLRFKESLAPLDRALPKLLQLEVVTYEHIQTEEIARMNLPPGPRVGFIAQQVAEVLPELVTEAAHPPATDPRGKSLEGEPIRYQALKPLELIPYLVRAIQEQQVEIEALKAELRPWRTRLSETGPNRER